MSTTGKLLHSSPGHPTWAQVLNWDRDFFPRPWNQEDWESLDRESHQLFVWETDVGVVGFALFGTLTGDEAAHLLKIFILPRVRATGTSLRFIKAAGDSLRDAGFKRIYLEVETENKCAVGFYQKVGFKLLRQLKAYYSDGTDALTMELTL